MAISSRAPVARGLSLYSGFSWGGQPLVRGRGLQLTAVFANASEMLRGRASLASHSRQKGCAETTHSDGGALENRKAAQVRIARHGQPSYASRSASSGGATHRLCERNMSA